MIPITIKAPLTVNWKEMPGEKINGETGYCISKVFSENGMNIRVVEYSRNYMADHWCLKGHFVYVIEGALDVEHSDNSCIRLLADSTYVIAAETIPHRVKSDEGARVFIVD
jgi:hypothetical protein